jgi:hypothetical protein
MKTMKYLANAFTRRGELNRARVLNLLAMASLSILPAVAIAQTEPGGVCNADLNASAVGGPLFYINEPITINLNLGAGIVYDGGDPPVDGWLDIYRFSYQMDCSSGDTWPDCTPAGNTVVFLPDSLTTDCTGEGDVPVTFETSVVDQEVIFEAVNPPGSIRNMSEQTCNVWFDIMVTGVADENPEREVIELTGFGNILGEETNDAICSNTLTAGQGASVSFDLSTVATHFRVTKEFSDDNPDPVDVHIRCDTGLPLEQDFQITKDTSVSFTVTSYEPGALSCDVWESSVDRYTATYTPGLQGGVAGNVSGDAAGCHFDNIVNGDFTCHITNTAGPATFTVNKEWFIDVANGDYVSEIAFVTIWCDKEITTAGAEPGNDGWILYKEMQGDDSLTATIDTSTGPTQCRADETFAESGIVSEDDCELRSIPAGGSSECTIVNTVFFEGIPTLTSLGATVMALLMLGVGMVGFRRFT